MTTTDRQGAGFWEQGEFGVFPGGIPVRRIGGEPQQHSTGTGTAQHASQHRHSKARLAQQSTGTAKHASHSKAEQSTLALTCRLID